MRTKLFAFPISLILIAAIPVIAYATPENRAKQLRLKQEGFYTGAVDGNFGPQSLAALRAFSRSHDAPDDLESSIPLLFSTARALRGSVTGGQEEAVLSAFESELLDSERARIRFDFSYNLDQVERAIPDTTSTVVCGEVNAPNSLGGMTGFQPFIVLLVSFDGDRHLHSVSQFGEYAAALCYLGTHPAVDTN